MSQMRDSSWWTLSAVSVARDTTSIFRVGSVHASYALVKKKKIVIFSLKNTTTMKESSKSSS